MKISHAQTSLRSRRGQSVARLRLSEKVCRRVFYEWIKYRNCVAWMGHAVALLVEALCYKLQVVGSSPDEVHFSIYPILPAALWPRR
jgi:hypothetical protein